MNILLIFTALSLSLSDGDSDIDASNMDELFPAPPRAKAMSLKNMLESARENSFAVQKALLSEESSKAGKDQGLAGFLPRISAEAAYKGNRTVVPDKEPTHVLSGTANLGLPLMDGGSGSAFSARNMRYQKDQINTEYIRQEVAYKLAVAYLQAESIALLLKLLREEAGAILAQSQIAAWRIASGIGSASEEIAAQMELISLQQEYLAARKNYIEQCEILGEILAQDGPLAPEPAENIQNFFKEPEGNAPEHLELTLAQKSLAIAEQELKSSRFSYIPSLISNWQIGATWPLKPEGDNTLALGVAVTLSIPLFNYSLIAGIKTQKAAAKSARLAYEEQKQTLAREERLALEDMRQISALSDLYEKQATLAEARLTLDMGDYQNGKGSALSVIESRKSHQVAKVRQLRQQYELSIARLKYWQRQGWPAASVINN